MLPETVGLTVTLVVFVVWYEMVAASPELMLVGDTVQFEMAVCPDVVTTTGTLHVEVWPPGPVAAITYVVFVVGDTLKLPPVGESVTPVTVGETVTAVAFSAWYAIVV